MAVDHTGVALLSMQPFWRICISQLLLHNKPPDTSGSKKQTFISVHHSSVRHRSDSGLSEPGWTLQLVGSWLAVWFRMA